MFEQVIQRIAELIANWQSIGFIHGVMNTDNMLLSGETIDFGPCAFMDTFDSAALYSSIDHQGRYAYRNQPPISHWNLTCLGQTLVPLLDENEEIATELAQTALNRFPDIYYEAYHQIFNRKLGLSTIESGDDTLVQEFLDLLEKNRCDFTLAFRRLSELPVDTDQTRTLFEFPEAFADWLERWQARCSQEATKGLQRHRQMTSVNPAFIPRNHLVEEAIQNAYAGDFSLFHRLNRRLSNPYEYDSADLDLATPPRPEQIVRQTFCGT